MTRASGTKCDSHSDLFSSTTGLSTARRQALRPNGAEPPQVGQLALHVQRVVFQELCLHDHIGPKSLQPLVAIRILPFESAVNRSDTETRLVQRHLAWKTLSFESEPLQGTHKKYFSGPQTRGFSYDIHLCHLCVLLMSVSFARYPQNSTPAPSTTSPGTESLVGSEEDEAKVLSLVFSPCSSHHLRMDSTLPGM